MTSNLNLWHKTERNETIPIEMAWIDIETTGLSRDDEILEVGVILTDRWAREAVTFKSLVVSAGVGDRIKKMIPFVREMHERSGLMDEIDLVLSEGGELTNEVSLQNVESNLVKFVQSVGIAPKTLPLSGSSVHFDHGFLDQHMPVFSGWFTHRNIDVSTVRGLCKMHNRPVYDARMKQIDGVEVQHRVLDDIRMSIDEYKFYVDNFLFTA